MAEVVELYQKVERIRQTPLTERQRATRELYDRLASERDRWLARNRFFYDNDRRYMQFLVPPGQRVLELGCGEGQLLRSLQPSHGVGVDLSPKMINLARERSPGSSSTSEMLKIPSCWAALSGPSITSSSPTWSDTLRTAAAPWRKLKAL